MITKPSGEGVQTSDTPVESDAPTLPQPENAEILDEIEKALTELKNSSVFEYIRSDVNGKPNTGFFRFVEDNDESSTSTILNAFAEWLSSDDCTYDEAKKAALKDAIEAESPTRHILLLYYGISEATPWNEASDNIVTIQTFKDERFPTYEDLNRMHRNFQS